MKGKGASGEGNLKEILAGVSDMLHGSCKMIREELIHELDSWCLQLIILGRQMIKIIFKNSYRNPILRAYSV
uniref:Uncharacterized protein n=1 Tax=Solanum lycopersicum TaxID=4081 RepID=A0A3Q7F4Y0_SOLLC